MELRSRSREEMAQCMSMRVGICVGARHQHERLELRFWLQTMPPRGCPSNMSGFFPEQKLSTVKIGVTSIIDGGDARTSDVEISSPRGDLLSKEELQAQLDNPPAVDKAVIRFAEKWISFTTPCPCRGADMGFIPHPVSAHIEK